MNRRNFVLRVAAASAAAGLTPAGCTTTSGSGKSPETDASKRQAKSADIRQAIDARPAQRQRPDRCVDSQFVAAECRDSSAEDDPGETSDQGDRTKPPDGDGRLTGRHAFGSPQDRVRRHPLARDEPCGAQHRQEDLDAAMIGFDGDFFAGIGVDFSYS